MHRGTKDIIIKLNNKIIMGLLYVVTKLMNGCFAVYRVSQNSLYKPLGEAGDIKLRPPAAVE